MAIKRTYVLIAGVALALIGAGVFLFAPRGGPPPSEREGVLKIGSQRGSTKAILEASGVLKGVPYRIEWSEFPSAQTLLESLAAQAVDTGLVGDAPFIFAYAGGVKAKVIQAGKSSGDGRSTAIVVPAKSPIQSVNDLVGRKVATGRGSIGHYVLLRVLQKAGISPDKVQIIFLAPGDAKAALANGSVDAWSTWVPYVALEVLREGARVVADGQGLTRNYGFQVATEQAIAAKTEILQDFATRLSKAWKWAEAHPADYAKTLSQDTSLPLDVAEYTVNRNVLRPVPIDPDLITDEEETVRNFREAGVPIGDVNVRAAFDPSFNAFLAK